MKKPLVISLAGLALLVGIGVLFTQVLVKPISTDLTQVGQGKPALVLAYENFSPTGGDALERLRRIKADYEAHMHFLVADLGTPEGSQLARRYQVANGQALFFNPTGEAIRVITIPPDEQLLRKGLNAELAAVTDGARGSVSLQ
ncbi:MAG: hypothetical protein HQL47_08200 [Gammaproteobacteria bacterium]|nr:hypothetical protein [Gammaproteobacteria bacterium]